MCTDTTIVIKNTSPFDDNAAAIQELTRIVKTKLVEHNRALADLQEHVKESKKHSLNTQNETNNGNIINSLMSRLYYTKEQFSNVLKQRTKTIKKRSERSKLFIADDKYKRGMITY